MPYPFSVPMPRTPRILGMAAMPMLELSWAYGDCDLFFVDNTRVTFDFRLTWAIFMNIKRHFLQTCVIFVVHE